MPEPGIGLGSSGCWICRDQLPWMLRSVLENLLLCSSWTARGVPGSAKQCLSYSDPAALGDGPFDQLGIWVLLGSCACRRMLLEGAFIHRPTGLTCFSVWVALCRQRHTPLEIHLKYILTGSGRQGRCKERKWQDSVITLVIRELWGITWENFFMLSCLHLISSSGHWNQTSPGSNKFFCW